MDLTTSVTQNAAPVTSAQQVSSDTSGFTSSSGWTEPNASTQASPGQAFNEIFGIGNAQRAFNAQQAQIQRAWEEYMQNTVMQRRVADMKAAGLNPVLAAGGAMGGGLNTPSGSSAQSSGAGHTFASLLSSSVSLAGIITSAVQASHKLANVAEAAAGIVAALPK